MRTCVQVTKQDARRAITEQFGGEEESASVMPGTIPSHRFPKYSNAYMLVYVRLEEWDKIMCEVGHHTLPGLA